MPHEVGGAGKEHAAFLSGGLDAQRDGLVIGEGAGCLVLEEWEHAQARGATIYAELVGFGTNSDGCHVTQPNAATIQKAMLLALRDAGLQPADIAYINAHGTGTQQGDIAESQATLAVFGGEYPGGALYTRSDWIVNHPKETQALANAIVATLKWLHSHTPEEIMAKMPDDLVGPDKALYLAALKNTIPMYSTTGRMDPKGAQAVLAVFSQSVPEVAKANIDLSKTYTNKFVDQANQKLGMNR